MPLLEMLQFSASFLGCESRNAHRHRSRRNAIQLFPRRAVRWRSAVPSYAAVAYENLYPGIDLKTWGQRDSLKYEFHVAPNADYRQIQVHYAGIEDYRLPKTVPCESTSAMAGAN